MELAKITQILGILTSVVFVIFVVSGVIWYAIYGRKQGMFKDAAAESQVLANTRKEKIAEHEATIAKHEQTIKELRAKALDDRREIDQRDDLNRQDRIAKKIYLRHIGELGGDVDAVEAEVGETVRRMFGNGDYTSSSDATPRYRG